MSVPGTSALAQPSVGASCVGSTDANGDFTSASAGGCDSSQTPAPSGSNLNSAQQMQLDAAYGVGSAIGSAFVDWLLAPPPSHEVERRRAVEQTRQRYQRELQRREQESLRMEQEHAAVSSSLKGIGSSQELAAKDLGNTGTLSTGDARTLESLKNQVRAIDCAMAGVYQATKKLGAGGAAFSEALNRDVLDLEARLPSAASPNGNNVFEIGTVSRDSMQQGGAGGSQMIANAVVSRHVDTGETVVIVSYSAGKGKAKEGQSVLLLDRDGNVECQQLSPAAAGCMRRYNSAYAAAEYCPNPPPERATR
jgi:hypothetical protein